MAMHAWRAHPQYHHLFDALSEPVLVTDEESRYTDANTAACDLLGYSLDELLTLRVADVVASPPRWTEAEFARYLRECRWEGQVDLRRKNGGVITCWVHARILPLPGSQAYLSVLAPTNRCIDGPPSPRRSGARLGAGATRAVGPTAFKSLDKDPLRGDLSL